MNVFEPVFEPRVRRGWSFAAGFGLLMLVVTAPIAAAERSLSEFNIKIGMSGDEWLLVPILADGAVESILALRVAAPERENITSVWYRRSTESPTSGAWQSWAWSEQDQSKVIGALKSALTLPDSTDALWPVAPCVSGSTACEKLEKGVLESDILAPIIASMPNPGPFVDMLEQAGWKAAWIDGVEGVNGASITLALDAIAFGVEQGSIIERGDALAAAEAMASLSTFFPSLCIPAWWSTAASKWSSWSCSPWSFASATPLQGCSCSCNYVATANRTCTRSWAFIDWDCSVVAGIQTMTESGELTCSSLNAFGLHAVSTNPLLQSCAIIPCPATCGAACIAPVWTTFSAWNP